MTSHLTGRYGVDEISAVLGDPRHAQNYYPRDLKERTVGAHSLDLVKVSRYYFLMAPKVIVDFEPSPLDDKMWLDEKRQWCIEQGIVYVPIMLGESLTKAQFATRVKQEQAFMEEGSKVHKETQALHAAGAGAWLTPELERRIDKESLRRLASEIAQNPNLRGASRAKRLHRLKLAVIEEARRGRMKSWGSQHRASVRGVP